MKPAEIKAEIAQIQETMQTPGFPESEKPHFETILVDLQEQLKKAEAAPKAKPIPWKDRPFIEYLGAAKAAFSQKFNAGLLAYATHTDVADAQERGQSPEKYATTLGKFHKLDKKKKPEKLPDLSIDRCKDLLAQHQKEQRKEKRTSRKISARVKQAQRRRPLVVGRENMLQEFDKMGAKSSRQKQFKGKDEQIKVLVSSYKVKMKELVERFKADLEKLER
ncbi:hypothetical protein JYU20_00665 [Bacteroidales bacterium AH-315-I05]|nr:hypothetical protein [Bacteroidales bacterium AH-315-I05]